MNSFNGPFLVPLTPRAAAIMATRRVNVSILTRPEGRMQSMGGIAGTNIPVFQSSPGQKAGCNGTPPVGNRESKVSILTRPEGRMQFRPAMASHTGYGRFNPHPARRPDAIIVANLYRATGQPVSILTRPEGRMQSRILPPSVSLSHVSILTRPEGRMQLPSSITVSPPHMFQSSPGQKAGCNILNRILVSLLTYLFQSSPGQKAGCNGVTQLTQVLVSLLFQSSPGQKAGCNCRVRIMSTVSLMFQSSPGQKAGCNSEVCGTCKSSPVFQSSPGQKAGCNLVILIKGVCPEKCFNPHPARRPDAIGRPRTCRDP